MKWSPSSRWVPSNVKKKKKENHRKHHRLLITKFGFSFAGNEWNDGNRGGETSCCRVVFDRSREDSSSSWEETPPVRETSFLQTLQGNMTDKQNESRSIFCWCITGYHSRMKRISWWQVRCRTWTTCHTWGIWSALCLVQMYSQGNVQNQWWFGHRFILRPFHTSCVCIVHYNSLWPKRNQHLCTLKSVCSIFADSVGCAILMCCTFAARTNTVQQQRQRPWRKGWLRNRFATSTTNCTQISTSGLTLTLITLAGPQLRSRLSECVRCLLTACLDWH